MTSLPENSFYKHAVKLPFMIKLYTHQSGSNVLDDNVFVSQSQIFVETEITAWIIDILNTVHIL